MATSILTGESACLMPTEKESSPVSASLLCTWPPYSLASICSSRGKHFISNANIICKGNRYSSDTRTMYG